MDNSEGATHALDLESLSDEPLLAVADRQVAPDKEAELSSLLDMNREGALTPGDRRRLDDSYRSIVAAWCIRPKQSPLPYAHP
jgi:hypothetical protein